MECKDCYKFRACTSCNLWFGCKRETEEERENCPFVCDKKNCQKEKED